MTDLHEHAARLAPLALKDLAKSAPAPRLSAAGWTADVSRHFVDAATQDALVGYGQDAGLVSSIAQLFRGEIVNYSEDRPALHWALRMPDEDASDEIKQVRQSVQTALDFAEQLRTSRILGTAARPFKSILHIGIGGSDFGPRLIQDAFSLERDRDIEVRFCANVDPQDFDRAIDGLSPQNTLVIGVSKSFGTEETLYNLDKAKTWLQGDIGEDWPQHLALITANRHRAEAWLEEPSNQIFDMPLSVGGRFSLWSAASLVCMLSLGPDLFRAFLAGANEMDQHVRTARMHDNMAARLALLDYWNTTIRGKRMRVLLAYANRLRFLPTYLQQLEMESNGKSTSPQGAALNIDTAPALWGGEGSIGQHSYHQWLHQGTQTPS
ncbi:MAG: glucose-6-phosphate isomerase, partial [Pseudomonadota bacterium]